MKTIIPIKMYLIEHLLQFLYFIGMTVMLFYLSYSIPGVMLALETVNVLVWTYFLKHILLLPIDILNNTVEREMYFIQLCGIDEYEIFRKMYFCKWYFLSSSGEKLLLIVPVFMRKEEIISMKRPIVNQKVKICYYKLSKILYSWEIV